MSYEINFISSSKTNILTHATFYRFWMTLIKDKFLERTRDTYKIMKLKNSVKVLSRHKLMVDYDTLYLSRIVNEVKGDDHFPITSAKLAL